MFRRRAWLYSGAVILASCSFVTDSCACVRVPSAMHVYGTLSVAGASTVGEFVSLTSSTHLGACGSSATATVMQQETVNVPTGHYGVHVVAADGMYCAILTASAGQRTRRDSVNAMSGGQVDSVRLDLTIP